MIKVAIADDHKLFRQGLRFMLDKMDDIQITYEASNGQELLNKMQTEGLPDVVLLDLDMPVMDGIETLKRIKMEYREVGVIILTMYDYEKMIVYAMEQGANGFLLKNCTEEEIQEAIEAVYREGYYFSDLVNKAALSGIKVTVRHKPTFHNSYELTAREREVLELICEEMTDKEIAEKLSMSEGEAEGYRRKLFEKMGAKNVGELVVKAMKEGLISLIERPAALADTHHNLQALVSDGHTVKQAANKMGISYWEGMKLREEAAGS